MITKPKKWPLQEAKNKFNEVVREAAESGPQTIMKHGKDSVVVISVDDYRKLEQSQTSLIEFFQNSPFADVEIDAERNKSPARHVEL